MMNKHQEIILEASLKEYAERAANGNYTMFDNRIILDGHGSKMGSKGLAIYMALSIHRNNTTGKCNPSMDTLAKETGISDSSILRSLKALEEMGYIIKIVSPFVRRDELGQIRKASNEYIIVPLNYVCAHAKEESELMAVVENVIILENVKEEKASSKQLEELHEIIMDIVNGYPSINLDEIQELETHFIQLVNKHGYKKDYIENTCSYYKDGIIHSIDKDSLTMQYKSA